MAQTSESQMVISKTEPGELQTLESIFTCILFSFIIEILHGQECKS